MNQGLTIVAAMLVLASCCPQIMPETSRRTDSVRTVHHTEYIEKLRDTTIFVELPIEVREQVQKDSSHLETSIAISDAWLEEGLLRHTLENKQASIPAVMQLKNTELLERNDSIIYRDVYIKEMVERKRIPKSYWWFMAVSVVSVLWTIAKLVRKAKKIF